MKKIATILTYSFACALTYPFLTSNTLAAEYSLYPKAGVYHNNEGNFERELVIQSNGKFVLEVIQKGKGSNLRSGSGDGQLNDAPGGWDFSQGRCKMTLKRASGGMQMHVEGCSSSWGDVPYDGKYVPAGEETAPATAPMPMPTPTTKNIANTAPSTTENPAAAPALPSRKELTEKWNAIGVDAIAGKKIQVMTKHSETNKPNTPIEQYAQAAFVVDTVSDYQALSAVEKNKYPLQLISIPLPKTTNQEGLVFDTDCVFGKSSKVIAISIAKANQVKSKRVSAWMLDNKLQLQEIKPASKVNCESSFY